MKVLSIKQMARLKELGVDTSKASMCYVFFESDGNKYEKLVVHNEDCYEFASLNPIPTFPLQDVIELLPIENIDIRRNCHEKWVISYKDEITFKSEFMIDAAYQMLIWVIENGHLKTK